MSTASSSTSSATITTFSASDAIAFFNRGPILTPFIPPTSCLSTLTAADSFFYVGNIYGTVYYVDWSCYPSGTLRSAPGIDPWDAYYYSPAMCPQGWTRATTITSSFGAYGVQLSLGTDTTAVVCCPQGFSYFGFDRKCSSTVFLPSTIVYFSPSSDADGVWSSTTDASTLVTSQMTVLANGIPVWAQASDAVRFASAASEAASTSSSSKTITTEPAKSSIYPHSTVPTSAAVTSTSGPHSNSNGLSTGAKIAIGIAIPFFILAIVSVIAIYLIRIRKSKLSSQENDTSTLTSNTVLMSQPRQLHYYKPELDSQNATIYELHANTPESLELPTFSTARPIRSSP